MSDFTYQLTGSETNDSKSSYKRTLVSIAIYPSRSCSPNRVSISNLTMARVCHFQLTEIHQDNLDGRNISQPDIAKLPRLSNTRLLKSNPRDTIPFVSYDIVSYHVVSYLIVTNFIVHLFVICIVCHAYYAIPSNYTDNENTIYYIYKNTFGSAILKIPKICLRF